MHAGKGGDGEKTLCGRQVLIKQVFKWACRERLIPDNPLARPKLREPDPTDQPCFSPEQISKLMAVAQPREWGSSERWPTWDCGRRGFRCTPNSASIGRHCPGITSMCLPPSLRPAGLVAGSLEMDDEWFGQMD